MPVDVILLDAEERMEKAVDVFRHQLTGIRTGRANPGLVDSLRVEVYGSPTPIKALASVGAPEPNQIVVRPFDPGTIKDIEKAIQAADTEKADGTLTEDDCESTKEEVQELTKKYEAKVGDLAKAKEAEVMEQ